MSENINFLSPFPGEAYLWNAREQLGGCWLNSHGVFKYLGNSETSNKGKVQIRLEKAISRSFTVTICFNVFDSLEEYSNWYDCVLKDCCMTGGAEIVRALCKALLE